MTHAQYAKGDKLREQDKDNNKSRTVNYEDFQLKSGGGNHSEFQENSSPS